MSNLKTKPTDKNVIDFLNKVENSTKRKDSFEILELMREITNEEPIMWGDSIIGFGSYHYKYKTGREGDTFLIGFSPRKQSISLYIMSGFEKFEDKLKKIGKHRIGKVCLYINKLKDIDVPILKELMDDSVKLLKAMNK
jgi:hypothetical protein